MMEIVILLLSYIILSAATSLNHHASYGFLNLDVTDVHPRDKRAAPRPDDFTVPQRDQLVNLHNSYRAGEGAANMDYMTWNPVLAEIAQGWADECNFNHGQTGGASSAYANLGQNIYISTGNDVNIEGVMRAWFNEKQYYTFSNKTCKPGKICGHYTQAIWYNSLEVGCGWTRCDSITGSVSVKYGLVVVCDYGYPGNYDKQPYIKGDACTLCDNGRSWCRGGLCDASCNSADPECECRASCQNCGVEVRNSTFCGCECLPGWRGGDCSQVCTNYHKLCNNGWPAWACNDRDMGAVIRSECPRMCGLCAPADGSTCVESTNAVAATTTEATSTASIPTLAHTTTTYTTSEINPTEASTSSAFQKRVVAQTTDNYVSQPTGTTPGTTSSVHSISPSQSTRGDSLITTHHTETSDILASTVPWSESSTGVSLLDSTVPVWAVGVITISAIVIILSVSCGAVCYLRSRRQQKEPIPGM